MLLRQIFDPYLAQYAYLIGCQRSGEALIIDPERDIALSSATRDHVFYAGIPMTGNDDQVVVPIPCGHDDFERRATNALDAASVSFEVSKATVFRTPFRRRE